MKVAPFQTWSSSRLLTSSKNLIAIKWNAFLSKKTVLQLTSSNFKLASELMVSATEPSSVACQSPPKNGSNGLVRRLKKGSTFHRLSPKCPTFSQATCLPPLLEIWAAMEQVKLTWMVKSRKCSAWDQPKTKFKPVLSQKTKEWKARRREITEEVNLKPSYPIFPNKRGSMVPQLSTQPTLLQLMWKKIGINSQR